MKLLILNGPRDPGHRQNPLYRGTYRAHPTHCDTVSDNEEINRLFFWFLEEGGELGVLRTASKAMRFAALWNERLPKEHQFEVVEVANENEHSQNGGNFLGYDLSAGYNNSLLSSGLRMFSGASQLNEPIRELLDLINRHYAPQLNGQGLFQTFEIASMCLRSMIALQDLRPNLFEGGNLRDFGPVGLYVVTKVSQII